MYANDNKSCLPVFSGDYENGGSYDYRHTPFGLVKNGYVGNGTDMVASDFNNTSIVREKIDKHCGQNFRCPSDSEYPRKYNNGTYTSSYWFFIYYKKAANAGHVDAGKRYIAIFEREMK